jgi:hypothetical protein
MLFLLKHGGFEWIGGADQVKFGTTKQTLVLALGLCEASCARWLSPVEFKLVAQSAPHRQESARETNA